MQLYGDEDKNKVQVHELFLLWLLFWIQERPGRNCSRPSGHTDSLSHIPPAVWVVFPPQPFKKAHTICSSGLLGRAHSQWPSCSDPDLRHVICKHKKWICTVRHERESARQCDEGHRLLTTFETLLRVREPRLRPPPRLQRVQTFT